MSATVLYIDDKPELPEQSDEMLAQAGYELLYTADPAEALRIVREQRPALVLAEVLLPDSDGFELIEQLGVEELEPAIPIVVVTRGERTPQLYGQALELGVKEFLCKPFVRAQILEVVLEFASSEQADAPSAPPPENTLEGDLANELLPELLGRLHRAGGSGVLTLRRGSATRAVQLRNGSPVEVERHRDVKSVADFLRQTQRIDAVQYEMLVDQLMARIGGPREILLGMGALSETQLASATYAQAREVLLEMCEWWAGRYAFQPGVRLDAADTLTLATDPTTFVHAALKRLPQNVIQDVLNRRSSLYPSLAESAPERLAQATFSPEQHTNIASLAGDRTLAEVLASSALDGRTLYTLISIGAVELEEHPILMLDQELKPVEPETFDVLPEDDIPRRKLPRQASTKRRTPDLATIQAKINEIAERLASQDDFWVFGISETTRDAEVRAAYSALLEDLRLESIPPELDELRARAEKLRRHLEQAYARVRTEEMRRAFASIRKKKKAEREAQVDGSRAVEAESWFRTGEGFLMHEDFGQALEAFGMAVHLDPEQGDYAAHLGYALYRSNPESSVIRREALEHVAKGVKLAPDREKPLFFLSRIFRETGDIAMAAKVLRRALKINPDSPALMQEMCLFEADDTQSQSKSLIDRLRGR